MKQYYRRNTQQREQRKLQLEAAKFLLTRNFCTWQTGKMRCLQIQNKINSRCTVQTLIGILCTLQYITYLKKECLLQLFLRYYTHHP